MSFTFESYLQINSLTHPIQYSRLLCVVFAASAVLGCANTSKNPEVCERSDQLGLALAHVQAARQLFSETQQRRIALAELEGMLLERILADPDSASRSAQLWQAADTSVYVESYKRYLITHPDPDKRGMSPSEEEISRGERSEYQRIMALVLVELDPTRVARCAQSRRLELYKAALRADALSVAK